MARKIDYAAMFTHRKDGRYQGYYRDHDGIRHTVCDPDPEKLFNKLRDKEAAASAPAAAYDAAPQGGNDTMFGAVDALDIDDDID